MIRVKFVLLILVPIVALLLSSVRGTKVVIDVPTATINTTTTTKVSSRVGASITSVGANHSISTTHAVLTHYASRSASIQMGSMVKRLAIIGAILTSAVAIYIVVKFCRSGRRKTRMYGVVKTPGDLEMRPLESADEEDDEDVTMFNRKD